MIQLLADDVVPSLPVCTYPNGQSFYLDSTEEGSNPNQTIPDVSDILAGTLQVNIDALVESTDADSNLRDVLENINADQIITDLMIKDEQGEHAIEVIVTGESTHASKVGDEEATATTEALTDEAREDLE